MPRDSILKEVQRDLAGPDEFPRESPDERRTRELAAQSLMQRERAQLRPGDAAGAAVLNKEIERSKAILGAEDPHRAGRAIRPASLPRRGYADGGRVRSSLLDDIARDLSGEAPPAAAEGEDALAAEPAAPAVRGRRGRRQRIEDSGARPLYDLIADDLKATDDGAALEPAPAAAPPLAEDPFSGNSMMPGDTGDQKLDQTPGGVLDYLRPRDAAVRAKQDRGGRDPYERANKLAGAIAGQELREDPAERQQRVQAEGANKTASQDFWRNVGGYAQSVPAELRGVLGGLLQAAGEGLNAELDAQGDSLSENLTGEVSDTRRRATKLAGMGQDFVQTGKIMSDEAMQGLDPQTGAQVVGAAMQSLAMMSGPLLAGLVTGGAGTVLSGMGVLTFGKGYGEAREEGLAPDQAAVYGALNAAVEVGTEYLPIKALLAKTPGFGKWFWNFLAREVPTEMVATAAQAALDKVSLRPNMTAEEFGHDMLITVLSTPLAAGVQAGVARTLQGKQDGMSEDQRAAILEKYNAEVERFNKAIAEEQKSQAARAERAKAMTHRLEDGTPVSPKLEDGKPVPGVWVDENGDLVEAPRADPVQTEPNAEWTVGNVPYKVEVTGPGSGGLARLADGQEVPINQLKLDDEAKQRLGLEPSPGLVQPKAAISVSPEELKAASAAPETPPSSPPAKAAAVKTERPAPAAVGGDTEPPPPRGSRRSEAGGGPPMTDLLTPARGGAQAAPKAEAADADGPSIVEGSWVSKKQLARERASERMKKRTEARRRVDVGKDSLLAAVIKLGGISKEYQLDVSGDTKPNPRGRDRIAFVGSLFRNGGDSPDGLGRRLVELGYLTPAEGEDPNVVSDRIREELNGTRQYFSSWKDDTEDARAEFDRKRGIEEGDMDDSPDPEEDARLQAEAEEAAGDTALEWDVTAEDLQSEDLEPTGEHIVVVDLLAQLDEDARERFIVENSELSEREFLEKLKETLNEQGQAGQAVEAGEDGGRASRAADEAAQAEEAEEGDLDVREEDGSQAGPRQNVARQTEGEYKAPAETGASPEDTRAIGDLFGDAVEGQIEDGDVVTHVFDPPKPSEVVRIEAKARVYVKQHGWMSVEQAKARIAEWRAHAEKQGATTANSEKIVLSLFDLTGEWSRPWEDAGYAVYRFDIQVDPEYGDVEKFSTEFFNDVYSAFEGNDVYAILAACPCTDFAVSGARHFAAKDADGRTIKSVELVKHTLATIEYFKPQVWMIENPVGRIESLTGLPPWRLSFNPNHFGDPYTKQTLGWGRFNADLPIAPVEPVEGSLMHKKYGGKSQKTKNARSVTPEGFAYAFFMANNAIDNPVLAVANKYDRLDRDVIEGALARGVTPEQIDDAVGDHYYIDLDDAAANKAIEALKSTAHVPHDYPAGQPKHAINKIAHGLREGMQWAMKRASQDMWQGLPDGAILVPVPGHEGHARRNRDLATEIRKRAHGQKIKNVTVVEALQGDARASQYDEKKAGRPMSAEQMPMRQVIDIPAGRPVFLIDGVMATGETMKAAQAALKVKAEPRVFAVDRAAAAQAVAPKPDAAVAPKTHRDIATGFVADWVTPEIEARARAMADKFQARGDSYTAVRIRNVLKSAFAGSKSADASRKTAGEWLDEFDAQLAKLPEMSEQIEAIAKRFEKLGLKKNADAARAMKDPDGNKLARVRSALDLIEKPLPEILMSRVIATGKHKPFPDRAFAMSVIEQYRKQVGSVGSFEIVNVGDGVALRVLRWPGGITKGEQADAEFSLAPAPGVVPKPPEVGPEQKAAALRDRNTAILTPPPGTAPAATSADGYVLPELGLHDDGSVTLLHGTTAANAAQIERAGFKVSTPEAVAALVEREFGLPKDSVRKHEAFQFPVNRGDLDKAHFTTDQDVALQYTIPEQLQDALTAAYWIMHPEIGDKSQKEVAPAMNAWLKSEGRRLAGEPALLAITVPWDVIGKHGFGKEMSLEEYRTKIGDRLHKMNFSLPANALRGATIRRLLKPAPTQQQGLFGTEIPDSTRKGGTKRGDGNPGQGSLFQTLGTYTVKVDVRVAETGQTEAIEMRADEALREINEKIALSRQLLECLRS